MLLPLVLLLHAPACAEQSDSHSAASGSRYFGVGIAAAGDANADGTPDFLVADVPPPQDLGCFRHISAVWLLSGRDGSVLSHVSARDPCDRFGCSIAGIGDVDSDGCADWVVGSNDVHKDHAGFAEVYSGKSGRRLFRFEGPHGFGSSVGAAGDVDGDGRPDVVVASDPDLRRCGANLPAIVYSGRDGSVLLRVRRSTPSDVLVGNPIGVGDIDGDGRSDLALLVRTGAEHALQLQFSRRDGSIAKKIVTPFPAVPEWTDLDRYRLSLAVPISGGKDPLVLAACASGAAKLISARDGHTVWEREADSEIYPDIERGAGMAAPGDIDGDGTPDIWMGRDSTGIGGGTVFTYSGRDGHTIYFIDNREEDGVDQWTWHFGASIVAVGDLDGDGVSEALIGTNHLESNAPGRAFVFSGKTRKKLFGLERAGDGVRVSR